MAHIFKRKLRALIGCECSGVVRDAFRARGWDAWSVDIKPSESRTSYHIQDDLFSWHMQERWDLFIGHPPCTYLSSAGLHWMNHPMHKDRKYKQSLAIEFFMSCINLPFTFTAIENPKGVMSTIYKPPTQYICPTSFGHEEQKMTGLWLKNLPKLVPTDFKTPPPRYVTPSGKTMATWYAFPKGDRQTWRSRTFSGIAEAMADQWGWYIEGKVLGYLK